MHSSRLLPIALSMMLLSSCIGELPLTIYMEQPKPQASGKPIATIVTPFNYTIELIGSDDTRGVIRFTQKKDDDNIILNIYAHDLPADHRYHLQYAIDKELSGQCAATNWISAGDH